MKKMSERQQAQRIVDTAVAGGWTPDTSLPTRQQRRRFVAQSLFNTLRGSAGTRRLARLVGRVGARLV